MSLVVGKAHAGDIPPSPSNVCYPPDEILRRCVPQDKLHRVKRDRIYLGVGLGLRRKYFATLAQYEKDIDWLEIISENFMDFGGRPREVLRNFQKSFPIIPHGVNLSLGSVDPINPAYLKSLKSLVQGLNAPFCSDHLCFSSFGGNYHHDLLPLPYTRECVSHLASRIRICQEYLQVPVAVENISDYARGNLNEMSESDFLRGVLQESGAYLLLDINNVYVNSKNHRYDPFQFIGSLPLDRVIQIHLAGHSEKDGLLIDTHGSAVCEEVWHLYAFTLKALGRPVSTLVEWDNDLPALGEVVREVRKAKKILWEQFGNESFPVSKNLELSASGGRVFANSSREAGNPC